MKRRWVWVLFLLAAAMVLLPLYSANVLRSRAQQALEKALNRQVKLEGKSHLRIFPWPALVVEQVTIAEDPRYALEPFAYVAEMAVEPSLRALLGGRLEAAKLRLTEPSVNLMRMREGWNVQSIGGAGAVPPDIEVRGGRLNFKQGNEKSAFYLANLLADISAPTLQGDIDVFVEAEPARTDRGAQGFGKFSLRGSANVRPGREAQIDFEVELRPSAIHAFNFFFGARSVDFAGTLSTRGRLRGPVSGAQVYASTEFEGLEAKSFLPFAGKSNAVEWKGVLDLPGQRFALDSANSANLRVRMRARDLFSAPRGAILVEAREVALEKLLDLTRQTNTAAPAGMEAQGRFSGVVSYSIAPERPSPAPVQGMIWFDEALVRLAGNPALQIGRARVVIDGPSWNLASTELRTERQQSATLEATWNATNGALRLGVATRELGLNELRSGVGMLLRAGRLPLLQNARGGAWQGNLIYKRNEESDAGNWSGTLSLRNSALSLDGLPRELEISSAQARFDANRVDVRRMRASWNGVEIEGGYSYFPAANRSSEFDLIVSEAKLTEVAAALEPALVAPRGILERIRFRRALPPEWLRTRAVRGRLLCKSFDLGAGYAQPIEMAVDWRGTRLEAKLLRAQYAPRDSEAGAAVEGDLRLSFFSAEPKQIFEGKITGWPAEGGPAVWQGKLEFEQIGERLWETARAEGTLSIEGETGKFSWREGRLIVERDGVRKSAAAARLWPLHLEPEP